MRKNLKAAIRIGFLSALLPAVGCYHTVDEGKIHPDAAIALPKPGPQQIVVDSRLAYSAEENRPAADSIVERARLLSNEGTASLEKLVQRWPDITLDMLRNSVAASTDFPLRCALARSYDHAFGATDPAAGWYAALSTAGTQRELYDKFRSARQQMLNSLQSGHFADAAKLDLSALLPSDAPPALRAEALRLNGLAYVLDEKPDRAAEVLVSAIASAEKGPTHPQFELGLLLCEAQRRLGSPDRGASAWTRAVAIAASGNVRDPNLWERAILSKPGNVNWPAVGRITGIDVQSTDGGTSADTGDVLIGIGKMRFSRRALQPALLAFSRAEAETTIKAKQDLARLYRAQSLVALQQPASALPMLETLIQSADPRVARRAKAVQGDLMCRILDDRRHGIPMMRDALSNPTAGDWPGLSQLSANLGLYCILEGFNDEGFRRLHEAESRFSAEGQYEDLAEALKNESACLRAAKNDAEADAVQNRADELCRKTGLPIGPLTASAAANTDSDYSPKQ